MKLEGFKLYMLVGGELWNINMNQNYRVMGFDLVDSSGQGGEFNSPWEEHEEYLNPWVLFAFILFGLSLVGVFWSHASWSHVAQPNLLPALSLVVMSLVCTM